MHPTRGSSSSKQERYNIHVGMDTRGLGVWGLSVRFISGVAEEGDLESVTGGTVV